MEAQCRPDERDQREGMKNTFNNEQDLGHSGEHLPSSTPMNEARNLLKIQRNDIRES